MQTPIGELRPPEKRWGKAAVKAISAELKRIRKARGTITALTVLDEARDPKSPLHKYFDWDDSSAAERFRLHQARELIRSVQVTVTYENVEQPVRSYLHVVVEDVPQYVPTGEIQKSAALSAQVVEQARIGMESWIRRYKLYAEMFSAVQLAEAAVKKLPKKRK